MIAMVLFIGYEGFGLITNAAADMVNPQKNMPKALYLSVLIVIAIYLAVSITVIGNLTLCLGLFCLLEVYTFQHSPAAVYTMIVLLMGSFLLEKIRY